MFEQLQTLTLSLSRFTVYRSSSVHIESAFICALANVLTGR